jgi:hypothetical protein
LAEFKFDLNLCATRGIIRLIAIAVGVAKVTLAALAVIVAAAIHHSGLHLRVKLLSFRLSLTLVTSIQTLAVLSVAQMFIFISLRMEGECFLMNSVRRGINTLAQTIPLFVTISRPQKVALDFLLTQKLNQAVQIHRQDNIKKRQWSRRKHLSNQHAQQNGSRMAGCHSSFREL